MAESHVSGPRRRALLMMFRSPFERSYPLTEPDGMDQELHALLNAADERMKAEEPDKPA